MRTDTKIVTVFLNWGTYKTVFASFMLVKKSLKHEPVTHTHKYAIIYHYNGPIAPVDTITTVTNEETRVAEQSGDYIWAL